MATNSSGWEYSVEESGSDVESGKFHDETVNLNGNLNCFR